MHRILRVARFCAQCGPAEQRRRVPAHAGSGLHLRAAIGRRLLGGVTIVSVSCSSSKSQLISQEAMVTMSTANREDMPLRRQDAPLISVIIPHYNDLANLERCIGLLARQTLPRSQFEVVVADNNSRCGLDEVKRVCGRIAHVVPAPTQGAGAARNAAVAASRGQILAFIDSDCRPTATWLERGKAALCADQ